MEFCLPVYIFIFPSFFRFRVLWKRVPRSLVEFMRRFTKAVRVMYSYIVQVEVLTELSETVRALSEAVRVLVKSRKGLVQFVGELLKAYESIY
jgi:hypothetical protein